MLPFRISIGLKVFTWLSKVVAEMNCLMYMDDWLVTAPSKEVAGCILERAMLVTDRMGFLVNKKSLALPPS